MSLARTYILTRRQHSMLCRSPVIAMARASVRPFVRLSVYLSRAPVFCQNDALYDHDIFTVGFARDSATGIC